MLTVMLACTVLIAWTGCTAAKRYHVLSFFFDGVPDPNALQITSATVAGQVARPVYSHKPYLEGKCDSCHTGGMNSVFEPTNTLEVSSRVCLKCHERVLNEYPIMHGPVVVIECLRCHAPHESNTAHLLAGPSPNICRQCHEPVLLSPRIPEHMDLKASCLDCHFGHGAEKHGMLRPNVPTLESPTTAPTAASQAVMTMAVERHAP